MTAPISESWTRIENWLAEHAPATHAALAPPADPADIAETERIIGRPLLRPLVASLLRHDGLLDRGSALLPGSYRLLGARETAAEWQLLRAFHDERTAQEEGDEVHYDFTRIGVSHVLYGHPQLVPVARDVCGTLLVLDHRPETERGRVHEAGAEQGIVRGSHGMWASLPAFMDAVATSLETTRPLDGHTPTVDGEHRLHWDWDPAPLRAT
ncbi:SMI1/KNR4 family protein [Streptomyces xanthophaeus]|uniref:SMI1/KNR4 family protein n=1 Tax=Streptomyces xanthophaeus TaxID=67385 RepID=UPI0036AE2470